MIQFNLLPDVKQQYIKARRTKRLVMLVSVGVSALAVFVLLLSVINVEIVQRKSLSDVKKDIDSTSKELSKKPNLDKILTVQNQLNTLPGLHDAKPVVSRTFTYLSQLTPAGVSINSLDVDYTKYTIALTGSASSLDQVNQYVDTLKSTKYVTYTTDAAGQKQQADDDAYFAANKTYPSNSAPQQTAFNSIVLTSFSKSDKGATYSINLNYDQNLFSNLNNVSLRIPNDTISNTSALFKKAGS